MQKSLDSVFKEAVKNPVTPENPSPDWIKKLENAATQGNRSDERVSEVLLRAPENQEKVNFFRQQYSDYSCLAETKPPEKPPEGLQPVKTNNYSQATGTLSILETKIGSIGPDSKVVFVGCGSQPNTVLGYLRDAGKVTGLDIDPKSIAPAKKAIADAKASGQVSPAKEAIIKHIDGRDFDYSDETHVTIASMVPNEQKIKILKQVRKTAKPGTIVTIRSVRGLKQAMYAPFKASEKDLEGFYKMGTAVGPDHVINHSEVYRLISNPPTKAKL